MAKLESWLCKILNILALKQKSIESMQEINFKAEKIAKLVTEILLICEENNAEFSLPTLAASI